MLGDMISQNEEQYTFEVIDDFVFWLNLVRQHIRAEHFGNHIARNKIGQTTILTYPL